MGIQGSIRLPTRRAAAALLAATLGVTQLGTALHALVVEHAYCAEHHELVEREVIASPVPSAATTETKTDLSDGLEHWTRSAPAEHEDEHCTVQFVRRDGVAAAPPRVVGVPLANPEAASAPPSHPIRPAPAIVVLRLAPKASPPGTA